jgi:hypothetical protein
MPQDLALLYLAKKEWTEEAENQLATVASPSMLTAGGRRSSRGWAKDSVK